MCNRARMLGEPDTLFSRFDGRWLTPRPMDNRFDPVELMPKSRAYIVRDDATDGRGIDIVSWDVLGGQAAWAMTDVRNLGLPQ